VAKRRVAIKEMSDAHLGPVERQRAIDNFFRQEANIHSGLKTSTYQMLAIFLKRAAKRIWS